MAKKKQAELETLAQEALSSAQAFLADSPPPKRKRTAKTKVAKVAKTTPNNNSIVTGEVVAPSVGASSNGGAYGVRSTIPVTSEQDYTRRFAAIQGQLRSVKIQQENLKLDKEIAVSGGLQNEVTLQETKNLIIGEKVVTESVKLNQQQSRTELERVKLQGIQLDVTGERSLLQPKQELNQIRLQGVQIDVEGSRALLEPQREKWALQFEMAELKLMEMRGQIQRQRAALGAGSLNPLSVEQID